MLGKKDKTEKIDTMNGINVPRDGLVHSVVLLGTFGTIMSQGNTINKQLVELQEKGAEIISASPFVFNDDFNVLCVFRSPSA